MGTSAASSGFGLTRPSAGCNWSPLPIRPTRPLSSPWNAAARRRATRLGGLADITVAAMVLMRALFDTVLIETVGVGQSEVDVATAADTVIF